MEQTNKSFAFRANCFDVIRMVSAVLIVVGHTSTHLNVAIPLPGWGLTGLWTGLICLFTISGYLIPASLERCRSAKEYLIKRFARLYPGLWCALALSLLALLIVGKNAGLTYRIGDLFKWIAAQISVFQFYTPTTIEAYGVGNPNGALWTISMEIQIYFIILLLWKWLKKRSTLQWIMLIAGALLVNAGFDLFYDHIPLLLTKLINVTFVPYAYIFLIGMFCYAKREQIIPFIKRYFWQIFIAYYLWYSIVLLVPEISIGHYVNLLSGIFVAVLTLSGGYRFGEIHFKHELSYGLYIYHMIIVNILVMCGLRGNWLTVPIVLCVSWILAYLSNRFVEKPIVRLMSSRT